MKKKFIATLMVGAMAASLFAGCGVQQTGGSGQTSSEKTEDKAEEKTMMEQRLHRRSRRI